jgi:hypothetical protein
MKEVALILFASAALCAAPAFAQEPAAAGATASGSTHAVGSNQTATSGDQTKTSGDQREPVCSKDNPNINYLNCVNANTRDRNAKVRMAQAGSAEQRS